MLFLASFVLCNTNVTVPHYFTMCNFTPWVLMSRDLTDLMSSDDVRSQNDVVLHAVTALIVGTHVVKC